MLLQIDYASDIPIYQQIRNQIVIGIAGGTLTPGEQLPTIRALADSAGINMMTVSKAYQLLKAEGYILTDRRSGAIVCTQDGSKKVMNEKAQAALSLAAAEAKLAGFSPEEFAAVCMAAYKEV